MTGHRLGIGSKPLATNFLELKLVVTLAQALFVVVEGNSRCHENGDDGGYDLSLKRRCTILRGHVTTSLPFPGAFND